MRQLELILISLLCCWHVAAQGQAQIHADELTYNFGTIAEADGPASHTFTISNPGDAPLVITRVAVLSRNGPNLRLVRARQVSSK